MNCEQFRNALLGDEPIERNAAERHATSCAACAELLEADRKLSDQVREWKDTAPAPPERLERRIAAAIARESSPSSVRVSSVARRTWVWAAAAVLLLATSVFVMRSVVPVSDGITIEDALAEADRIQQAYARAIARLEQEVEPILAHAGDPDFSPQQAGLLLSYRDRLTHLDAVIAEVQSFLGENPGHSGGHTVLLAAYKEKREVLGTLLELQLGEKS